VLVQNAGKELGINVKIELRDDYYDSYWVSWDANTPGSDLGITDYGHRGVPDVFLNAPLLSVDKGGVWNAAEFANADYDAAVATYTSSVDLQSQQAAALKIQEILQDESPLMIPYNFNFMSAAQKNISGVTNSGMGQVYAENASKS
jgi:peptide/nickel transport system substrate-binding protein